MRSTLNGLSIQRIFHTKAQSCKPKAQTETMNVEFLCAFVHHFAPLCETILMRETLLSFLDECIAHGEQTAVGHWRGLRIARWSYARLASGAYQFARELEARNIGAGDRVLFWSENTPEWIVAFYGCLLRGAVVVPLDLKSAPDFAARVQQQVSAKLLLTDEPQIDLPHLSLKNLNDVIAKHSSDPYRATPNDLVQIVFTSGTTAAPKGVCLTHRNLLANIA